MNLYTIQLNSFIKLVRWSCYYSCNQWVVFVSSYPNTIFKWVIFKLSKFSLFLTSTSETIHCHMYFHNPLNFTWFYLNNTNILKIRPLFSKKSCCLCDTSHVYIVNMYYVLEMNFRTWSSQDHIITVLFILILFTLLYII